MECCQPVSLRMLYKALNVNIHNFHNIYPDLAQQNYKIGREIDDKCANSKITRQEWTNLNYISIYEMKDTLDTMHKMYKDETDVNGGIGDNQPLIIMLQGQHVDSRIFEGNGRGKPRRFR